VVPLPMVASKYPFLLCSSPQSPDSSPLPTVFYSAFSLRYVSSLRPYFVIPPSGTQDRPQSQSIQTLAHTFRHARGGLPAGPIFEFRFSSFIPQRSGKVLYSSPLQAASSISPLSATFTKNTGGWGTVDCQSRALLIPHAFGYTHKLPQFLSSHGFIS
jgi:hypothetical protein